MVQVASRPRPVEIHQASAGPARDPRPDVSALAGNQGDGGGQHVRYQRLGDNEKTRPLFARLAEDYARLRADPKYFLELELDLIRFGARPTPLLHVPRLSAETGGARLFIKREDVGRTDTHLMVNTIGQAWLARTLGRKRLVAGIRNVKWGVMLAAVAARYGLTAQIYVDEDVAEHHAAGIFHIQLLGGTVHAVNAGQYRANDVREAALQEWLLAPDEVFLFLGLDAGLDPYPAIVRDLTAVAGRECRRQVQLQVKRHPDIVVTRDGGNSDAISFLPAFLDDHQTRRVCVEALTAPPGTRSSDQYDPFNSQLSDSQASRATSILDGLEFPGVERERAWLRSTGSIEYTYALRDSALNALRRTAMLEGLVVGLQTAHALSWACDAAAKLPPDGVVVVLMAERGEKDIWDIKRLTDAAAR